MYDIVPPIEELNHHGYDYISTLGRGGFGIVLLAKHRIDGQQYAIKKLLTDDPKRQQLILREIKALAPLNHPHVVNYKTSFTENGHLYLVMEYCQRGTLHNWIRTKEKLEQDALIKIFLILTKTFSELHRKKIIHHDIKPSNILIDDYGQPKISDFGCVNTSIGTIIYSAPEQIEDESSYLDPRVDIFSLGITLLEAVLGYHPLLKHNESERMIIIKNGDYPISILPYWLQEIILKSCHFNPGSRFQTMDEFHHALIEKDIPKILNQDLIETEKKAQTLKYYLIQKRWEYARKFIESNSSIQNNLNFLIQTGKYFLATHQLDKAKQKFELALKINQNAPIEKEIAEVYLQLNEPAKATSILTNYINRNFYDLEAHNQLLNTYFLSTRWDLGVKQAELSSTVFPNEFLFKANLILFELLVNGYSTEFIIQDERNPFSSYNYLNVFKQNDPETWSKRGNPTFASKLLFQEYKFKDIDDHINELELTIDTKSIVSTESIISFGRTGYACNTHTFEGTNVSRRHFVIINQKNNVWLYDLESTGIYIDGVKVKRKYFLLGLHEISFGGHKILVKSDSKLLL